VARLRTIVAHVSCLSTGKATYFRAKMANMRSDFYWPIGTRRTGVTHVGS